MSSEKGEAAGLTLVNASAGSGKTHRLTEEVVRSVDPKAERAVDLEGLVAVTYTRKAAAELAARIRRSLVSSGQHEHAQRLPLARVGTVHAVCLRIVQENAIDAGLSPEVDVLPGDEARLLRQALEWGLAPELRRRIQQLAYRLQLRWDQQRRRTDWLTPVGDIMTLARSNRIAASALPAMAERAVAGVLALLGTRDSDAAVLDQALIEALSSTDAALGQINDETKATAEARQAIREALKKARTGPLLWADWVRLQKLNPGAASRDAVKTLISVAACVDQHPRLHAELTELTRSLYGAAAEGLRAYQQWKTRRRVVDFVDMIDQALTLVETPDVAAELGGKVDLLVVDELQDTSPVQLALFLRLHELATRSTWVGDPKQCIFEYAGADPDLMQAVADWSHASGGNIDRLGTSYRSRPELVDACSQLFTEAFGRQGFSREDVVITANRSSSKEAAALPPFGVWSLDVGNNDAEAATIADGIQRMLASPSDSPIVDRVTGEVRAVRPGDIAVLVATNAETVRIAGELARRGIRAALARAGLLSTPEGIFVEAALRRVLDPRDSLAEAELSALTGFDGQDPDAWLAARIATAQVSGQSRQIQDPSRKADALARLAALDALRGVADALAPSEVLDRVLTSLDVIALASRWPDPKQRLANLDALRALALCYEDRCRQERESATLAGLIRYFAEAAEEKFVRDEEIASDDQHVSEGDHAVTLVTYHRAKGLEWPVVILSSLHREPRRDAFEVTPEADRQQFDPRDPLGGRWIRYWPWPFGGQRTCGLAERAAASPEGTAVAERERRERVRLLYVGFTRARDHLVLAVRRGKKKLATRWLDELADDGGDPLVTLPFEVAEDARGVVRIGAAGGGKTVGYYARHWTFAACGDPARIGEGDQHVIFTRPEPATNRRPYRIAPSRGNTDWPELADLSVVEVDRYGTRIPLGQAADVSWDVVGDALHGFFAADGPELSTAVRLGRADRLLDAVDLQRLLEPNALLAASDQVQAWMNRRWPGARRHRELPISALVDCPEGVRRADGVIDLLLETPDGVVVIDYKTFPGASSMWSAKALELAPQLAAYAHALELARRRVIEMWFCFAVGGGAVRVAAG